MSDVSAHGPLFDGRATEDLIRGCEHAAEELGQSAYDAVKDQLREHIKHPTGRYESQVRVERQQDDLVVNDGGMVYGPWLEGVGSRNFPRTRFRGYRDYRIATQELDGEADAIVSEALAKYIEEMNA